MLSKTELLICNGKGHFMLFVENEEDTEPLALYHEEE